MLVSPPIEWPIIVYYLIYCLVYYRS
jgi:hypothetical protein